MTGADLTSRSARIALGGYFALWGLATSYLALKGADWTFPIASMVIFGCLFSGLGWLLTRKSAAPDLAIAIPKRQSRALLVYLLFYALVIFGWLYGGLKAAVPPGQLQELAVVAFKLVVSVALPSLIVIKAGGTVRPLWDAGLGRKGFWSTLIILSGLSFALLSVVSPALEQITALHLQPISAVLAVAGAWAWVSLEAGLCEEYLFRAVLQSRLAAWLRSPVAAIIITSILFSLTHVPGLWLRGTPDTDGFSTDLFQVIAFTVATLSPISLAFGVLWQRSRSLLLVVLVHGAVDALPFTAEFVRIWWS
ncbi:MAG: hypothetical protein RL367_2593 [Pseudomonadota bacterium]